MISFLNIMTVLYLFSFVFVFQFFLGEKNSEMNSMMGINKSQIYGVFFVFPFMAIGIFFLELLNSISFLFTKKLITEQKFFVNIRESMEKNKAAEKEKREKNISKLKSELNEVTNKFLNLKLEEKLTKEEEEIIIEKIKIIRKKIAQEKIIVDTL